MLPVHNTGSPRPPQSFAPLDQSSIQSDEKTFTSLARDIQAKPKANPVYTLPPEPLRTELLNSFLERGKWIEEGDEEYTLLQMLLLKIVQPALSSRKPDEETVLSCYHLMDIAMGFRAADSKTEECLRTLGLSENRQKSFPQLIRYQPYFDKTIGEIISGKKQPIAAEREFHLLATVHNQLFSLFSLRSQYFLKDLRTFIDKVKGYFDATKKRGKQKGSVQLKTMAEGEELFLQLEQKVVPLERLMPIRQRISKQTFLLLEKLSQNTQAGSSTTIAHCLQQLQTQRVLFERQIEELHSLLFKTYVELGRMSDACKPDSQESDVIKLLRVAKEKAINAAAVGAQKQLPTELITLLSNMEITARDDKKKTRANLQNALQKRGAHVTNGFLAQHFSLASDIVGELHEKCSRYKQDVLPYFDRALINLRYAHNQVSGIEESYQKTWTFPLDGWDDEPKPPKKITPPHKTQTPPKKTAKVSTTSSPPQPKVPIIKPQPASPMEVLRETSHLFEIEQKKALEQISIAHLENDAQQLTKLAQKEVLHHLFMSQCGYQLFFQALKKGNLEALSSIVPTLVLDWHVQIEQMLSCHYIANTGEKNQTHHLEVLSKLSGKEISERDQDHLKNLDYGLIWSRYPINSAVHYGESKKEMPNPLEWTLFTNRLAQSIVEGSEETISDLTVQKLEDLVSFVSDTHLNTLRFIAQDGSSSTSLDQIEKSSSSLKTEIDADIASLKGQKYTSLKTRPSQKTSPLREIATLETNHPELKEMTFGNPFIPLQEATILLQRQEHAQEMLNRHPDPYFLAWHYRNSLNYQRVFEQLYISQGISREVGNIMTHRFEVFHKILNVPNPKDAHFDCLGGLHYPHVYRGNPHLANLLNLTKQCKNCGTEGFSYATGSHSADFGGFSKEVDETLQNGHNLAKKHFRLAINDLKKVAST